MSELDIVLRVSKRILSKRLVAVWARMERRRKEFLKLCCNVENGEVVLELLCEMIHFFWFN